MSNEPKQYQQLNLLDIIDSEIFAELKLDDKSDTSQPMQGEENAARKPFRLRDFDSPRDKEMTVFTHAKKLSEYLFVITEKSPKKFRWNIVGRLLTTSTDVIEYLYRANYERGEERLLWQKKAMVALNLLDFYADTAKTKQAINFHQMTIIVQQIVETQKLLSGWVRATKKKDAGDSKRS